MTFFLLIWRQFTHCTKFQDLLLALAPWWMKDLSYSFLCERVYGCTLASSCEHEQVIATVECSWISMIVCIFAAEFFLGCITTWCTLFFCEIHCVSGNVTVLWELF
jgi:hypothetical protein